MFPSACRRTRRSSGLGRTGSPVRGAAFHKETQTTSGRIKYAVCAALVDAQVNLLSWVSLKRCFYIARGVPRRKAETMVLCVAARTGRIPSTVSCTLQKKGGRVRPRDKE